MKIIGLTGGIGSGKSTIAKMFKQLDIPLFIADDVAKSQYNDPEVKQLIEDEFGTVYVDDHLDREALAKLVFSDQTKLDRLNTIIHPRVHKAFEHWISKQNSAYVIYEAAIIFELGRADFFDQIILVTSPEALRIDRVVKRDHISKIHVKERIDKQWPDHKKRDLADYVITNIDLSDVKKQVQEIHENLLNPAK